MMYSTFCKTYPFISKNYPATSYIYDTSETFGMIETRYTKRGSRWIITEEKPLTNISAEQYCNIFDAVPFFRRLGGWEKVDTKYTRFGKIPFRVYSISPDRKTRVIREIYF